MPIFHSRAIFGWYVSNPCQLSISCSVRLCFMHTFSQYVSISCLLSVSLSSCRARRPHWSLYISVLTEPCYQHHTATLLVRIVTLPNTWLHHSDLNLTLFRLCRHSFAKLSGAHYPVIQVSKYPDPISLVTHAVGTSQVMSRNA